MQMENNKIRKKYTAFIVLLPLISVYASGVPGFTLGDILLVVFFLYRIVISLKCKRLKISKTMEPILLLTMAIPVITMISLFGQEHIDIYNMAIRIVRCTFYYLSVAFASGEWFDISYGKKVAITVGRIGAIYLVIQYIAYYGGHIVLHGYLPFLPVYHESYAQLDYGEWYLYHNMFRPTSFLLEPAHFARYLCIPLIFELFDQDQGQKGGWLWPVAMSGAIIASTSGIGTICTVIIWAIWFLNNTFGTFSTGKINKKFVLLLGMIFCVALVAIRTDIFQSTIYRITNSKLTNVNTAGGARFRGYLEYFKLPFFNQIVGMGYGSTPNTDIPTWFSGASFMLYGCGIVGFLICIYMFVKLLLASNDIRQRTVGIIFFMLFLMDDCFKSHVSVLYLSFMCATQNNSSRNGNILPNPGMGTTSI